MNILTEFNIRVLDTNIEVVKTVKYAHNLKPIKTEFFNGTKKEIEQYLNKHGTTIGE